MPCAVSNGQAHPRHADPWGFPPVPRQHILNCSYDSWYHRYEPFCMKSRIIPLSPAFVQYLQEDGIILADDDDPLPGHQWSSTPESKEPHSNFNLPNQDSDSSEDDDDDEPAPLPPNQRFPDLHNAIRDAIKDLGGAVVPKLNWSAPKDATWISAHQNTLKCTEPNDVYLLLKSSIFVSHDLDHALDDCTPSLPELSIQHVLVLRPFSPPHLSLEFRCFVKERSFIGICPRELKFHAFLLKLRGPILDKAEDFFEKVLRTTFEDESYVFDIYFPEDNEDTDGLGSVQLVDINPWAPRTDSLLFDWGELLAFQVTNDDENDISRALKSEEQTSEEDDDDDGPELRLVETEDVAGYNFSAPQYSASKLPKEIVDATSSGQGGMREFVRVWREATGGRSGLFEMNGAGS